MGPWQNYRSSHDQGQIQGGWGAQTGEGKFTMMCNEILKCHYYICELYTSVTLCYCFKHLRSKLHLTVYEI